MPVDPADSGPLALSPSLRPPVRRTIVLGARNEGLAAFADEPVRSTCAPGARSH